MPFCDAVNNIKLFYRTYGSGPIKVLMIIGVCLALSHAFISRFCQIYTRTNILINCLLISLSTYTIICFFFNSLICVGQDWLGRTSHGTHRSRHSLEQPTPMMMKMNMEMLMCTMITTVYKSALSIIEEWAAALYLKTKLNTRTYITRSNPTLCCLVFS